MDAAEAARLTRLFGEPVCPHPEVIGPHAAQAILRMRWQLQSGREIWVCRVCWALVPPPPLSAPRPIAP